MITLLRMAWLGIVTLYQSNPYYRLRARIVLLTYQLEAERLRADRLAAQLWQAEIRLADDRWYKFDNEQLKQQQMYCQTLQALATMRLPDVKPVMPTVVLAMRTVEVEGRFVTKVDIP
jgi:hypothetical protein